MKTIHLWDFTTANSTSQVDGDSNACIVFINAFALEDYERAGLHDVL
jgi:hypothetical protein